MMTRFSLALLILMGDGAHAATLIVDPSDTRAADEGSGPYETITYALKQLRSGDVLTIKAGVYRESLILPKVPNIAIEGESGAVIKGSDVVNGWEAAGNDVYVRRNWTVNSQQVFVDNVSLQQVGGNIFGDFPANPAHEMHKIRARDGGIWPGRIDGDQTSMAENSFYYDAAGKNLYVRFAGGNLNEKLVEASTRRSLVFGDGLRGARLKNLTFTHANASASGRMPAVRLGGIRIEVERIRVTWTDSAGIGLVGDNNVLKDSLSNYNGQLGIAAKGRNVKLIDNETSYNNQRGFNQSWEAGGAKFIDKIGAQDFEVVGHKALFNKGNGIWFDGGSGPNKNNKISGSISAHNGGHGIHYEVSGTGLITNNYVYGNKLRGIYLANGFDSIVEYNFVAMNGLEGIVAVNDRRVTATDRSNWLPKNNQVRGNIIAWNKKRALVLPEEGLGNSSDCNLFVDTAPSSFHLGWHLRTYKPVSGLSTWQSLSGQDRKSRENVMPIPEALNEGLAHRQVKADLSALPSLIGGRSTPMPGCTKMGPAPL